MVVRTRDQVRGQYLALPREVRGHRDSESGRSNWLIQRFNVEVRGGRSEA